ncbi:hypothetical protein [Flavobacterium sp. FlaQc-48]|uniref:hypothetical protein n=1 Tax=Flavobacterium sp. FlaQc-48 TaxID=3374181 RepID=UPI00375666F6
MEEINRLISVSKDSKYYSHKIKEFNEKELKEFETLALRLEKAGAANPLSWAFSEVKEGIPQFGRFLVLKNLFDIIESPKENISLAEDFDEEIETKYLDIEKVVGEEKLSDFLKTFSKAIISNVVSLLDEGNFNSDRDKISWALVKTDENNNLTEQVISGLHEDFIDFED